VLDAVRRRAPLEAAAAMREHMDLLRPFVPDEDVP
jgi:DNA-binding GntR family transcriptional regulator